MDEEIAWADQHEAEASEVQTTETEISETAQSEAEVEQTEAKADDVENTEEGDADTETKDSDAEGSKDQEKEKRAGKKRNLSERFRQLTNQRKDAERRATEANARAEKLEEKLREMSDEVQLKSLDDFQGNEDAYSAYLRKMDIQEVLKNDRKAQIQEQVEEARENAANVMREAWFQKVEAYTDEMPDYNQVVGGSQLQVPPDVVQYAMESDIGPRMLYVLAKNPQKAQQLFSLPQGQRTRQTVNLENACLEGLPGKKAPVSKQEAPEQKPKATAPPSGSSQGGKISYSKEMSMEAYAALRAKQRGR